MKRLQRFIFLFTMGSSVLLAAPTDLDQRYCDYFFRLQAANLFRQRAFVLQSVKSYVDNDRLEKVELHFSCYKALSLRQARELMVTLAQDLITKINSDPTLCEKKLLPTPFRIPQIHLTLEMQNAITDNADSSTISLITLEAGEITYTFARLSPHSYRKQKTLSESFVTAATLANKPAEDLFFDEVSAGTITAQKAKEARIARIAEPAETPQMEQILLPTPIIETENNLGIVPSAEPLEELLESENSISSEEAPPTELPAPESILQDEKQLDIKPCLLYTSEAETV